MWWSFKTDRPVLLIFWASWCPYCQRELPELLAALAPTVSLHNSSKDEGVTIVGILYKDKKEAASAFIAEEGMSFINVDDSEGTVAKAYSVKSIPLVLVVDKQGYVRYTRQGVGA